MLFTYILCPSSNMYVYIWKRWFMIDLCLNEFLRKITIIKCNEKTKICACEFLSLHPKGPKRFRWLRGAEPPGPQGVQGAAAPRVAGDLGGGIAPGKAHIYIVFYILLYWAYTRLYGRYTGLCTRWYGLVGGFIWTLYWKFRLGP